MTASRSKLTIFVLVALVVGAAVAWAQKRGKTAGLCHAQETSYFNCKVTGAKWVSLCGDKGVVVQYRFGTPERLELRFPAPVDKSALRFAHYSRAEVDRIEISFDTLGAHYSVFEYTEDGQTEAGVRVTKANGHEATLRCVGPVQSRLAELENSLECDAESALNLGGCGQ